MSDHEWCRDVSRDEAVRAAEDAAAVPSIQHRDLPEQVALLWASLGDIIGRVVRLEGEMDAGQDDSASPAEGLRTERVTLEVTHCATKSIRDLAGRDVRGWLETFGESVRVVDEADAASDEAVAHGATLSAMAEARESLAAANRGIARLTAERDAAIRERDAAREQNALLWQAIGLATTAVPSLVITADDPIGMMRRVAARVAELEAAAAPAANAGVEKQEPVAWGVRRSNGTWWRDCRATRGEMLSVVTGGGDANNVVSPLYARPPRGWLTADERGALKRAFDLLCDDDGDQPLAGTVQQLLARETPPMVRRPEYQNHSRARDCQWIAAIRAAGGEVEW